MNFGSKIFNNDFNTSHYLYTIISTIRWLKTFC